MDLSAAEWSALALSLKVGLVATLLGLPIATLLALMLARRDFPLKSLVDTLLHLPLVLPPVVIGYLLLVTLSPVSLVGGWLQDMGFPIAFHWHGAALASLMMALPLMIRAIRQSFESTDPALLEAAAILGAGPAARFFTVTLPLALPGLLSAAILGFARALGEFGATITLAANIPGLTQTLPLALYSAVQTPDGEAIALRLALIALIPAVGSLVLGNMLHARFLRGRGLTG